MRVQPLTAMTLVLTCAVAVPAAPAAAAARRAVVACGSVLTADTTLSADVTCSPAQRAQSRTALTLGAGGISLDLGGHAVGGEIAVGSLQVPGVQNVTVRHGTAVAVRVRSSFGVHLADLHLTALSAGYSEVDASGLSIDGGQHEGMVSTESSQVDLDQLTITRADVLMLIGPVTLTHSTLIDSTVTLGSWGTREIRATITDNRLTGGGIRVDGQAAIERNTITSAPVGVDVIPISGAFPSGAVAVRDNTITGGLVGIRLRSYWFGPDVASGNTVRNAGAAGILLIGETGPGSELQSVPVTGNTVSGNGFHSGGLVDRAGAAVNDGLHVDTAAGTPLQLGGNHATGNADYGIEAVPGSVQDGGGNTATGNPRGCLGVTCSVLAAAPPATFPSGL